MVHGARRYVSGRSCENGIDLCVYGATSLYCICSINFASVAGRCGEVDSPPLFECDEIEEDFILLA